MILRNKTENLEVIDLYDNKNTDLKVTSREMKRIKDKAKAEAESKYIKKKKVKDNDLIDVFEGNPPTPAKEPEKKEPKKEDKKEEKKEDKKEDKKDDKKESKK